MKQCRYYLLVCFLLISGSSWGVIDPDGHYKTLQIESGASGPQVKKAYRKLAKKWHPDKNPENIEEATEKFQKIGAAYAILGDVHKRKEYDLGSPQAKIAGGRHPAAADIFEMFFGRPFRQDPEKSSQSSGPDHTQSPNSSNPHGFGGDFSGNTDSKSSSGNSVKITSPRLTQKIFVGALLSTLSVVILYKKYSDRTRKYSDTSSRQIEKELF